MLGGGSSCKDHTAETGHHCTTATGQAQARAGTEEPVAAVALHSPCTWGKERRPLLTTSLLPLVSVATYTTQGGERHPVPLFCLKHKGPDLHEGGEAGEGRFPACQSWAGGRAELGAATLSRWMLSPARCPVNPASQGRVRLPTIPSNHMVP